MKRIEDQIQTWSESDRKVGRELSGLLEKRYRDILVKAYSASVPNFTTLEDSVYQSELKTFKSTMTGNFSEDYFRTHAEISSAIAKEIDYPQFLMPGYSTYAAELTLALVESTRWHARKKQRELIHALRVGLKINTQ